MEGARRGKVGGEGLAVSLNEEGHILNIGWISNIDPEGVGFQILTLRSLVCRRKSPLLKAITC